MLAESRGNVIYLYSIGYECGASIVRMLLI